MPVPTPEAIAAARQHIRAADALLNVSARHNRCGWIAAADVAGYAAFAVNASYYDAIHPVWYRVARDGVGIEALAHADDPGVIQAAAGAGVLLWPLVAAVDSGMDGPIRAMLSTASQRASHVRALVALATAKGYAGVDIDYEHLKQPGDQALYTAFAAELGAAMTAAGHQVSLCLSALSRPVAANSADYYALGLGPAHVLHLMGYDYHGVSSPHAGPVSPTGWIELVCRHAAATGHAKKFVLGLPNYGCAPGWFRALGECIRRGGTYATTSTHMKSCPFNNDGLVDTREPNATIDGHTVFFDDALSLEEKVKMAAAHGLGGIAYWTVGDEAPDFLATVARYY